MRICGNLPFDERGIARVGAVENVVKLLERTPLGLRTDASC